METDNLRTIQMQNDVIIGLLSRMVFSNDEIVDIVTKNKQNPSSYVDGYNALDGKKSLSDVAKTIGVRPATLSPIMRSWQEVGIVYEIEESGRKCYRKLFSVK